MTMEDPGTLIYIAFLAISLIAGYFQNRKKKANERQREVPVDVFIPDQRELEQAEEEAAERNKAAEVRIKEMERAAKEAKSASIKRERRVRDLQLLEDQAEERDREGAGLSDLLGEEFDAKKAIIYSEILKRPEHE